MTHRFIFILSYPVTHIMPSVAGWAEWRGRDRWMPGLLSGMGADVELWGTAPSGDEFLSELPGFGAYRVRLFPFSNPRAKSRDRYSDAMVHALAHDPAAIPVIIGADGGGAMRLWKKLLKPSRRRFVVIIGGNFTAPTIANADLVFTESAPQAAALGKPRWFRKRPRGQLMQLPKSIDTDSFAPRGGDTQWDIVALSRLHGWKSFDEIGALAEQARVAVIGGGPRGDELARAYPRVAWLGHHPHPDIPALLSKARLFVHAGRRESFPRAIVEAMACGLPVVAFDDHIGADVVPPACGLLVNPGNYRQEIAALLADEPRRAAMAIAARNHAVHHYGLRSTEAACRRLIALAEGI